MHHTKKYREWYFGGTIFSVDIAYMVKGEAYVWVGHYIFWIIALICRRIGVLVDWLVRLPARRNRLRRQDR